MIKIAPPLEYPRKRARPRVQFGPPPVTALTLVEASFDEGAPSVRLAFDRAIDIAGLAGAQITVDAGNVTGTRYEALGTATMDGGSAVVIGLLEIGPSIVEDTLLSASAATGIVGAFDAATWAGVTELVLPYP